MLIGIDAGGSKTDILITDDRKNVIWRGKRDGVNAARLGATRAAEALAEYLREAHVCKAEVMYAGVAGAGTKLIAREMEARLSELLPGVKTIRVESDAFNALNAEVGLGDGIVLIAGTGSAAFLRRGGDVRQVGGRGFMIDDAGSGYWVGRACLNASYRSQDGRGLPTLLLGLIENKLNARLTDAIPALYAEGPAIIASLAPLAFEAARLGDDAAAGIVDTCAGELALLARAAAKDGFSGICVASGGLFRAQGLCAEVARRAGIPITLSDKPPVEGALAAAAYLTKGERNELR